MTTTVHVIHLDWGSSSDYAPVILAAASEHSAYVHTARYLKTEASAYLTEQEKDELNDFLADHPYDPDTATPEEARAWVTAFQQQVWTPFVTIEQAQVLA